MEGGGGGGGGDCSLIKQKRLKCLLFISFHDRIGEQNRLHVFLHSSDTKSRLQQVNFL